MAIGDQILKICMKKGCSIGNLANTRGWSEAEAIERWKQAPTNFREMELDPYTV